MLDIAGVGATLSRCAIALVMAVGACAPAHHRALASTPPYPYASYGAAALTTLENDWYDRGRWRLCLAPGCRSVNQDWGADAITYALYLRWKSTHDVSLAPYFWSLASTARRYGVACEGTVCSQLSDVPEWDALAALRDYEVVGNDDALPLEEAKADFDVVDLSNAYALGACPGIDYQRPFGGHSKLKTLETDSNAIRVALLLYRATGLAPYLEKARRKYAAVRRFFLDPNVPLYTAYVFDDGADCRQLPRRFFASVNGNMIEAGLGLYHATRDGSYRRQAIATAAAADTYLSDGRKVFADLQAENDVAEPLVEAMYDLAQDVPLSVGRDWILRNATAAVSARALSGNFGRFFDGPPPSGPVTAWQTNGGFALMFAAASLASRNAPPAGAWRSARTVRLDISLLPARITFHGDAIALFGTIGERCCESGHARVSLDGRETFDRTGIWQNKSSSGLGLPDSLLFAWRWPRAGVHTILLEPGMTNAKEGEPFIHIRRYAVLGDAYSSPGKAFLKPATTAPRVAVKPAEPETAQP